MTAEEKIEAIRNILAPYADKRVASDDPDFCVYDFVGSNVDDAYQLGVNDGEVMLMESIMGIIDGGVHIELETSVKLVTAEPRTLETKEDMAKPSAYTHDLAAMSELTQKHLNK